MRSLLLTWTKRISLVALGLLLLVSLALFLYARASLPQYEGEVVVPKAGLVTQVSVSRDAQAVPLIEAQSLDDAWFAVGYLHAQERRWQLEMNHRIASGRLAELLGPAGLETDRFLRTLGIRRAAQAQLAGLDAQSVASLQRYADGVNAATANTSALSPEFTILGAKPTPWTPVDSLAWAIMMAWDLSANWSSEVLRMRMAAKYSVQQIEQLLPRQGEVTGPIGDYATFYRSLGLDKAIAGTEKLLVLDLGVTGVEGLGSNNWVLGGARTKSGKPLLANDPHLGLAAPALWYLVRIKTPQLELAGASLPGLPYVVLGRNQHVAWGFTNTSPDSQDLYLERFEGEGGVAGPKGTERVEVISETIKVKGKPDETLKVRVTPRGPIISEVSEGARLALGAGAKQYGLSFAWNALAADNVTARAGFKMNIAKSADEFLAATRDYGSPQQNMVYADTSGQFGRISAGRVPIRAAGHDFHGLAPAPAWDPKYAWVGTLKFEDLPQLRNPSSGYEATANQNILTPKYPHFITSEWSSSYRMDRIVELIEATPKHDVASLRAIQADVKSLAARHMLKLIFKDGARAPMPKTQTAQQALALLKAFDGTMSADRAEPLIYNAWMQHLGRRMFADELIRDLGQGLWDVNLSKREFFVANLRALDANAAWCDDVSTAAKESCADTLAAALDDATAELVARHGNVMSTWRWGPEHAARSEHRPFGKQALLAKVFDLRVETGGDTFTVNVGRTAQRPGEPFINVHAASLRAIYDLDASGGFHAAMMHSTGQSGVVFSKHYRDLSRPWSLVEFLELGKSGSEPKVLKLVPR